MITCTPANCSHRALTTVVGAVATLASRIDLSLHDAYAVLVTALRNSDPVVVTCANCGAARAGATACAAESDTCLRRYGAVGLVEARGTAAWRAYFDADASATSGCLSDVVAALRRLCASGGVARPESADRMFRDPESAHASCLLSLLVCAFQISTNSAAAFEAGAVATLRDVLVASRFVPRALLMGLRLVSDVCGERLSSREFVHIGGAERITSIFRDGSLAIDARLLATEIAVLLFTRHCAEMEDLEPCERLVDTLALALTGAEPFLPKATAASMLHALSARGPLSHLIVGARALPCYGAVLANAPSAPEVATSVLKVLVNISRSPECQMPIGALLVPLFRILAENRASESCAVLARVIVTNLRSCTQLVTRLYRMELHNAASEFVSDVAVVGHACRSQSVAGRVQSSPVLVAHGAGDGLMTTAAFKHAGAAIGVVRSLHSRMAAGARKPAERLGDSRQSLLPRSTRKVADLESFSATPVAKPAVLVTPVVERQRSAFGSTRGRSSNDELESAGRAPVSPTAKRFDWSPTVANVAGHSAADGSTRETIVVQDGLAFAFTAPAHARRRPQSAAGSPSQAVLPAARAVPGAAGAQSPNSAPLRRTVAANGAADGVSPGRSISEDLVALSLCARKRERPLSAAKLLGAVAEARRHNTTEQLYTELFPVSTPPPPAAARAPASRARLWRFEHVDGAHVCENTFSHITMPDGRVVHMCLRGEARSEPPPASSVCSAVRLGVQDIMSLSMPPVPEPSGPCLDDFVVAGAGGDLGVLVPRDPPEGTDLQPSPGCDWTSMWTALDMPPPPPVVRGAAPRPVAVAAPVAAVVEAAPREFVLEKSAFAKRRLQSEGRTGFNDAHLRVRCFGADWKATYEKPSFRKLIDSVPGPEQAAVQEVLVGAYDVIMQSFDFFASQARAWPRVGAHARHVRATAGGDGDGRDGAERVDEVRETDPLAGAEYVQARAQARGHGHAVCLDEHRGARGDGGTERRGLQRGSGLVRALCGCRSVDASASDCGGASVCGLSFSRPSYVRASQQCGNLLSSVV